MSKKKELNPKQRRFVAEYLKDQNGTQAAIRAGYSKKTAQEQSSELLSKPMIRAEVDMYLKKVTDKALVTTEFVVSLLKENALRSMQKQKVMEFDWVEKMLVQKKAMIENQETGALEEVGIWEYDSMGANKALELLGKYLKILTDRKEVTGADGKPLIPESMTINLEIRDKTITQMKEMLKVVENIIKTWNAGAQKPI